MPHAQGHGSSLLPGLGSISLNLPSLPSVANLSLPKSALTQAAAAQTAAPVRRVKRPLDVLRLGARRGVQAAGAGVLAAHGHAAALFTGYPAKKSLPVGTDFTPDPATPALPSYLKTADKNDAAWLAAVIVPGAKSTHRERRDTGTWVHRCPRIRYPIGDGDRQYYPANRHRAANYC